MTAQCWSQNLRNTSRQTFLLSCASTTTPCAQSISSNVARCLVCIWLHSCSTNGLSMRPGWPTFIKKERLWARCFSMMQRGSRRYASRAKCSPFIIQYMRGHGPSPLHARILPAFRLFVCSTLNLGRVCAPSPFLTPSADSSHFPAFRLPSTPNLGRICAPSSSPTARADSSCFLAFSLS